MRTVDLRGNRIEHVELVAPFLSTTPALHSLDLGGNPITKLQKYREQLIVLTTGLQSLDGKKIMQQEREYLLTLQQRRQGGLRKASTLGGAAKKENMSMNKQPPPAGRVLPPSKVRKNNAPGKTNLQGSGLSVMGNMKPLHQGYEEEEDMM